MLFGNEQEADLTDYIAGLLPHEQPTWLPDGDDLTPWLQGLRDRHADALDEYQRSIAGAVDANAAVEADARGWRRKVRDATAQGKPAPEREQPAEVGEARIQIAAEDSALARDDLAIVCIEILAELRQRPDELRPFFLRCAPELRHALGAGPAPDGLTEAERERRARLNASVAELAVPDIDQHPELSALGENRSVTTNAA